MRAVPQSIQGALGARDFTGPRRAVSRATIQIVALREFDVGDQTYSSIVFPTTTQGAMELPNLRSVQWQRAADQAVASCTLTFLNARPLPPGAEPPVDDSFDQAGYFTYNRGHAQSSTAWGQLPNEWQDYLLPDRLIRLYQGYGVDWDQAPENDPHMLLMGCWLIDDVTYSTDGTISVECRDYARLLQDQIAFPPVVPLAHYPLAYLARHSVQDPPVITTSGSVDWEGLTYDWDSNVPYIGRNGTQHGHHGTDAFDANPSTFWMSIGNARSNAPYSFEYVQGKTSGKISAARVQVWGGPYTAYLSVRVGNTWQGGKKVPYDPHNPVSAPNGSDIPYIFTARVDRDGGLEVPFAELDNVTAVRWTFTNLFNSGLGPYVYRAGVRSMAVIRNSQVTTTTPGGTHVEGNFDDFTDIVKWLLAYGGFYWPEHAQQRYTGTHTKTFTYAEDDPVLGKGRIFGDLEQTGAPAIDLGRVDADISELKAETFLMKPLMDGLTTIRDQLGYLFFVDENGGAIWRLPNLFRLGSWAIDADGQNAHRVDDAIKLTDVQVILQLSSKLSSRNSREQVICASLSANKAALARVSNINPSAVVNFRRAAVWTNLGSEDQTELTVAAELLSINMLMAYRQNSVTIPADPRIQVDDQVQLSERITGEDYRHYVHSINSTWDAQSGKWTYELTTSWLGDHPEGLWAFSFDALSQATQDYLNKILALGEAG